MGKEEVGSRTRLGLGNGVTLDLRDAAAGFGVALDGRFCLLACFCRYHVSDFHLRAIPGTGREGESGGDMSWGWGVYSDGTPSDAASDSFCQTRWFLFSGPLKWRCSYFCLCLYYTGTYPYNSASTVHSGGTTVGMYREPWSASAKLKSATSSTSRLAVPRPAHTSFLRSSRATRDAAAATMTHASRRALDAPSDPHLAGSLQQHIYKMDGNEIKRMV